MIGTQLPSRGTPWTALVDKWFEANKAAGPKPTAMDTPFRHSDAGNCARQMAYTAYRHAEGITEEVAQPFDLPSTWAAEVGTIIHELWQEAIIERHPEHEWQIEPKCGTELMSGHVDGVADGITCYELKNVGSYKFDLATGVNRSRPRSARKPLGPPDLGNIIQLALNAKGTGCTEGELGIFAKEAYSFTVQDAHGLFDYDRFIVRYHFTDEELSPLADGELARVKVINDRLDAGFLVDRYLPGLDVQDKYRWDADYVKDPDGRNWPCRYCAHQPVCIADGPGEIPIGISNINPKKDN